MRKRNHSIDTLRGLACILVVAYHVIGGKPGEGLDVSAGLYREINDILAYIRMPLFTFLSGMVYAYKPFSGNPAHYIRGKFVRLIVPMLVVGTLFAWSQAIYAPSGEALYDWQTLHLIPVAHFWFIEALFIIFLLMVPLESLRVFNAKFRFALVLVLAVLANLSCLRLDYFAVSGVFYLLPFFLIGAGLQRFCLTEKLNKEHALLGFLLAFALLSIAPVDVASLNYRRSLIALIIGMATCLALISLHWQWRFLARIGVFSYTIYLYHIFFTAGTRELLLALEVENLHSLFLCALTAGLLGPIFVEKIFAGSNTTRLLLLGKSRQELPALWLTKRLAGLKPVARGLFSGSSRE